MLHKFSARSVLALLLLCLTADASIIVVAPPAGGGGGFTQQQKDDDFATRATASSAVLYATNFDDVYLDGAIDNARSGITDTAGVTAEAFETPGADQYDYNTDQRLSGSGSLRMWRLDSDAGGTSASWAFRPDGDRSGIANGSTSVYRRHYVQFAVRMSREFLAWRANDSSSPKIFKAFNDAFADGEVPVVNRVYGGFVAVQANNPTEQLERVLSDTGSDPFLGDMKVMQPALYPTGNFDGMTESQAIQAAGPIIDNDGFLSGAGGSYSYTLGDEWLDERASVTSNGGFPNSVADVVGQPWEVDDWTVVTLFADFDATPKRLMVWASKYGEQPVLIVDDSGTLKEESNVANYHQAVVQSTAQNAETGVRPTSYRWYDEFIASTDPIPHPNPGGTPYELPGNLGGLSGLSQAAAAISAGGHANYTNGEQAILVANDLAWTARAFYYGGKVDVFGKSAGNDTDWTHIQFDEAAETWTDKTSNGANSPSTINTTGHIYDNAAMNPDNGDLFLVSGNEKSIRKYDRAGDSWSQITADSWPTTSHADGVAYHPNLYGSGDGALIVSTSTSIRAWRESLDSWETLASGLTSSIEGCGVYIAQGDYVLIRGDDGESLYRVNNDRTVDDLGAPPIRCSGGSYGASTHGSIHAHPDGTSKIILIEHDTSGGPSNRYWTSTDQGSNWSLSVTTHDLHAGGSANTFGGSYLSIPDYEVMWCISESDARLWKPD